MDLGSRETLTIDDTRSAPALGTLRDGAPFGSLVPFVVVLGATVSFYIHISRLAHDTQDILADPRVGLMVAETEADAGDPQRLARVCIEGVPSRWRHRAPATPRRGSRYLARFPDAAFNFNLADFSLFRIMPARARYVAGFGRIFDLSVEELVDPNALSR